MRDRFQLLTLIAQTLCDKKGFNTLVIDVRGISTLADYFLIAEGNADKHVISLATNVIEILQREGETPAHVEGLDQGDWVVIDYVDIIAHLFKPGMRDRYRLEELWQAGSLLDLVIAEKKATNF